MPWGPIEIVLEYKTDTLHRIRLFERVLVHGVGVRLETQFAVFGQHILHIEVAKKRSVAEVIVAIAEIAIDKQLIDRVYLEIRLILLAGSLALAVSPDVEPHSEDVSQFAEPRINLPRERGGEQRIGLIQSYISGVLEVLRCVEPVENQQINDLPHQHLVGIDDRAHLTLHRLVRLWQFDRKRDDWVKKLVGHVKHTIHRHRGPVCGNLRDITAVKVTQ